MTVNQRSIALSEAHNRLCRRHDRDGQTVTLGMKNTQLVDPGKKPGLHDTLGQRDSGCILWTLTGRSVTLFFMLYCGRSTRQTENPRSEKMCDSVIA